MYAISIFGGTGFIGTQLINYLANNDIELRVFTRNKNKANHLKILPNVKLISFNQKTNLHLYIKGSNLVINLVGILHESKDFSFLDIHEKFPQKIAKISQEENVKRFIHISALKADAPGKSKYLLSKLKGEKIVKKEFNYGNWTLIRPSVVFGAKDNFINLLSKMLRFLPLLFLVLPYSKFQPIFINDFVEIVIKIINDKNSYRNTLNIAGPKTLSFIEIVKLIKISKNKKNILIPLTKFMSYLFVKILEMLPFKIITRDNLRSMEIDNITEINDSYIYKPTLISLETYLNKRSLKT